MTRARTLIVAFLALSNIGCSEAQTVRCTTWNLEWFPNGSAKEASAAQQEQRIKEAADVLRPIAPDILLLQEVRDYDVCARLGEAIAPGVYHVAICSAFKEPFQRGLGKQHRRTALSSQDRARIVFHCPMTDDLSRILSRNPATLYGSRRLHPMKKFLHWLGRRL